MKFAPPPWSDQLTIGQISQKIPRQMQKPFDNPVCMGIKNKIVEDNGINSGKPSSNGKCEVK
jgi:hypothetical protein